MTLCKEEMATILEAEGMKPFDLSRPPLLAVAVGKLSPDTHIVLVNMHHVVMDGWSLGRVIPDMLGFYYSITQGRPHGLPPLPYQFSDYAAWEQAQLDETSDSYKAMVAYWRQQLAHPPTLLQLPLDKPRPPAAQGSPSKVSAFLLQSSTVSSLKQLASSLSCSLYALFLSIFRCEPWVAGTAGTDSVHACVTSLTLARPRSMPSGVTIACSVNHLSQGHAVQVQCHRRRADRNHLLQPAARH